MSGLWRDHPASLRQKSLFKPNGKRNDRPTQADVLITMLRDARSQNRGLDLPAIMQAGIAQHGARFNEIRSRGFQIENELQRGEGPIRSSYVLKFDPERDGR